MALKRASEVDGTPAPTGDAFRDQRIAWSTAWDENRDQYGRPKVKLPGGREVGYRRASSYGGPLESEYRLTLWKLRQVARGVARGKALRLEVTRAEVGLDSDNRDEAKASRDTLDGLCERAMDSVGSGDAASIGTSLHHVCELIDRGEDPGHVPEEWTADVAAWRNLTRDFRMVSIERIVVQDHHRAGGTLDRVAELLAPLVAPDGTVIPAGATMLVDQKTSGSMDFAGMKFSIQCYLYASGQPYDPITKTRLEWGHAAPRTDWALIAHTPSGTGEAALYWVDLAEAAEGAEDARRVHAWRSTRGKKTITRGATHADLMAEWTTIVAEAEDVKRLHVLHRQAVELGVWSDTLKAIFSARREVLEAATTREAVPA